MVVQVNGKVKDRIEVSPDITEEDAVRVALASERLVGALGGVEPSRVVARPPDWSISSGEPGAGVVCPVPARYEALKPASSSWIRVGSMRYGA